MYTSIFHDKVLIQLPVKDPPQENDEIGRYRQHDIPGDERVTYKGLEY